MERLAERTCTTLFENAIYAKMHNDALLKEEILDSLVEIELKSITKKELCFLPFIAAFLETTLNTRIELPSLDEIIYEDKTIDSAFILFVGIASVFALGLSLVEYTDLARDVLAFMSEPFEALSEETYKDRNLPELKEVFYRCAFEATRDNRWQEMCRKETLEDSLFLLLDAYRCEILPLSKKIKQRESFDKGKYGLFTAANDFFSLSLLFSGQGGPLGRLESRKCNFPAFGPSYFPLGQMNLFGIHRQIHDSDSFDDVISNRDSFTIEGWTRVVSKEGRDIPGDMWLGIKGELSEKEVVISLKTEDFGETPNTMAFVFFIEADRIILEKKIYEKSLCQYRGPARPIFIEKGDERLVLSLDQDVTMQVIPLAGDTHFWGAEFLIAYELVDKNIFNKWTISQKTAL